MRHHILLLLSVLTLSLTSCREDFEFEPSTGGLEFSKETVYLDTVFTNIGSSTYTLKVYNRSDKDISIPSIKLGRPDSKYRLMVDGMPGTSFNNVELMAKDSMFVMIETTASIADANPEDFLYTDEIQFHSMNGVQKVNLVTLIQDAVFIFPDRPLDTGIKEMITFNGQQTEVEGHELSTSQELHWTNEKPYVIYGYALVPNGQTLVIDPGARVHFHADAALVVDRQASLQINGDVSATEELENEVIFEGDRLEYSFSETPGQWDGLLSISETNNNNINHLTLKNATIGIMLRKAAEDASPRLTINNSQIYNCSVSGISAQDAVVNSTNLAMNNCGVASLLLELGGTYNFKHATVANYFNKYDQVPLLLRDYVQTPDAIIVTDLNATFENCIFYGSTNYGIQLGQQGDSFNYTFRNCVIKFNDVTRQFEDEDLYDFTSAHYQDCRIADDNEDDLDPEFVNPNRNNLHLEEDSGAMDSAFNTGIAVDIEGKTRANTPDIGAYEYYPAED